MGGASPTAPSAHAMRPWSEGKVRVGKTVPSVYDLLPVLSFVALSSCAAGGDGSAVGVS